MALELTIYKVYNRVVHSYLAVFEVTPTGSEDPNIFVCKDLPANPPIPPAPPQETSSLGEMSSGPSPADTTGSISSLPSEMQEQLSSYFAEQDSSAAEQVSSLEAGSSVIVEETSSAAETSSTEFPSAETPSTADVSSTIAAESSEESSSETPLFVVFPARTLVSIASLTDIDVLPLVPYAQGTLYRASTVSMIFRSKKHMNQMINLVVSDILVNAEIQRMPIEGYEVVELTDPVYGQDEDQIYYFR